MVEDIWQKVVDPSRAFIIAEAGVNHNGDIALAKKLVDAACEAGADAVKFQMFKAELLVTAQAPKAEYQKRSGEARESQFDMLKKLELGEAEHKELFDYCQQKGICFLSTPFDQASADFLDKLGMSMFKISSGDVTNLTFLQHVARKKRPMIVSTGMATLEEVQQAVEAIQQAGGDTFALLHCVSSYPAVSKDANLNAIKTLSETFHVPIGFSDHTFGILIPLAAIGIGAKIIEKHFTLDRNLPGPDHPASLEPGQLKEMIQSIREIEGAFGTGEKVMQASEQDTADVARKSLVAACDINAGTVLDREMLTFKRPGTGISPAKVEQMIGKKTVVDIKKDQTLTWEMVE